MRVLLDTNVLASAVTTRGLCADVLREVLAKHELVVCSQIFSELRRILQSKFGMSSDLIKSFVWLLQQDTILSKPGSLPKINLKDKDDLGILAAAQSGGADVVVTGDRELQTLGDFLGIKIMSPRQFWQELTA
jgi:putative PIN family toxin of toxin-antitoxin system